MIEPIVDVEWLARHRDEVVLLDVRWALGGPPGHDDYAAGHLPGAVFADLDVQLSAPASVRDGRHPLPTPEAFAAAMRELGVGDGSTVVAYDAAGGSSASRVVWLLRVLGHDAALLDGGLAAWPGELETGDVTPVRADFTVRAWPADRFVDADTTAALADGSVQVLDARVHGRFTGEQKVAADPRPGHVPGATSAAWQDNLGADGRFRSADQLRGHYAERGVTAEGEAPVVYCGSGVTACHDLLALERAGIDGARLYPGSWSQWAADETRPVETGS